MKAEILNIRASAAQKSKLTEAAKLRSMNVSQFVLSQSLAAADDVISSQVVIRLSAEDFDNFVRKLDEPANDLPTLRALLIEPSFFESK